MKVKFKSGKEIIRGELTLKGQSLIIICHGLSSNRKHPFIKLLTRQFNKAGYSTLTFDFTGRGESGGKLSEGKLSKRVLDLSNAIKLAGKHSKKIGLIGHSMGGPVILLNHSKTKVKALVSVSGVYDTKKTAKAYLKSNLIRKIQVLRAGRGFFKDLISFDLKKTVKLIKKPLLIINGDKDRIVRKEQALSMYNDVKGPKKLNIIKGCGHNFRRLNCANKAARLAIRWFNKYL